MPDFPTAGPSQEADLSHTERREIVVKHESLGGIPTQAVYSLSILTGSQSSSNQCLSLTPGKQGRTMGSREQ